jgi:hypothetical protein
VIGAQPFTPQPGETPDATVIRRLALYERLSGWAWLVLAIFQVVSVFGILAGAWNIYASITRFKVAPRIERRETAVPGIFEPLTGYVIIGVVNFLLGGVIGLVFLAVDLFVRDQVLKHRGLFSTGATSVTAESAAAVGTDPRQVGGSEPFPA